MRMNQKEMCISIHESLMAMENYHSNPLMNYNVGARIAVGEKKEDALDFALWKASKRRRNFTGKVHGEKDDLVGILNVLQWRRNT